MIGCSLYTREKWERFEYLLNVNAMMWRGIMQRCRWAENVFSYFDFFAGPGLYTDADRVDLAGEYGSPIRALRVLEEVFSDPGHRSASGEPLGIRGFFSDSLEWERLRACLVQLGHPGDEVRGLICDRAVDDLLAQWTPAAGQHPRKPVGLAFFDPNGQPPWDAIGRFAGAWIFDRIDLLINVNATVGKRVRLSPLHAESRMPTEYLRSIGKKYIYLWEPSPGDSHQFALAFCTNCTDWRFPEFARKGFHALETEKGQRIARRIDLTDSERRRAGGSVGFLAGMEDC
jgi:hypothetical protein